MLNINENNMLYINNSTFIMSEIYNNNKISDIEIISPNKRFYLHKSILQISSKFFSNFIKYENESKLLTPDFMTNVLALDYIFLSMYGLDNVNIELDYNIALSKSILEIKGNYYIYPELPKLIDKLTLKDVLDIYYYSDFFGYDIPTYNTIPIDICMGKTDNFVLNYHDNRIDHTIDNDMDITDCDITDFIIHINKLLNDLLDTNTEYFSDISIHNNSDIIINKCKIYRNALSSYRFLNTSHFASIIMDY